MAQEGSSVDLALVLAVDVSASVDFAEFGLMIGGLASAFRAPEVVDALLGGAQGAVAVVVLFWSGARSVELAVPWLRVSSIAEAEALAGAIEAAPRLPTPGGTALGDGIAAGLAQLERCPFQAARRVIDVSGDGQANQGLPVAVAREAAVLAGVGINGLAVVNEEPDLLAYYTDEVIAGPGAFAMQAIDYADFAEAIRRKLVREARAEPLMAAVAKEARQGLCP